jgi:peptide/nickel transport system substrate-binding protein
VPDESTRVTGLMSGEYHFSHMIPYDAVLQVQNMPGMVVDIWPFGIQSLIFNKKQGLFADVKARQAVNYALDKEAVLTAAFTDKQFYTLNPGLFQPEQKDWYSDAGKELYNPKDLEKAKQLLKEAGYNGEEVVILTSREYPHHYNSAVATQQQLEKIGMKVKLDVYDWATLLERRGKPEMWDIFYTGFPIMATPHQYTFLDSRAEWPGWTNDPQMDKLLDEIKKQKSQEKSKELYAQLQQRMWENLPIANIGTNLRVSAYSDKVQGYKEFLGPVFWNVTVKK